MNLGQLQTRYLWMLNQYPERQMKPCLNATIRLECFSNSDKRESGNTILRPGYILL